MTEQDVKTILALADSNMRPTEASYRLYLHRNTVLYRIDRIKKETGLDPLNFYDLHKLVDMAGKERKDQ